MPAPTRMVRIPAVGVVSSQCVAEKRNDLVSAISPAAGPEWSIQGCWGQIPRANTKEPQREACTAQHDQCIKPNMRSRCVTHWIRLYASRQKPVR